MLAADDTRGHVVASFDLSLLCVPILVLRLLLVISLNVSGRLQHLVLEARRRRRGRDRNDCHRLGSAGFIVELGVSPRAYDCRRIFDGCGCNGRALMSNDRTRELVEASVVPHEATRLASIRFGGRLNSNGGHLSVVLVDLCRRSFA